MWQAISYLWQMPGGASFSNSCESIKKRGATKTEVINPWGAQRAESEVA